MERKAISSLAHNPAILSAWLRSFQHSCSVHPLRDHRSLTNLSPNMPHIQEGACSSPVTCLLLRSPCAAQGRSSSTTPVLSNAKIQRTTRGWFSPGKSMSSKAFPAAWPNCPTLSPVYESLPCSLKRWIGQFYAEPATCIITPFF